MCSKVGYGSQREAANAVKTIKKTSHRSHIPKRVYFCKECKRWVLTSQKNKFK